MLNNVTCRNYIELLVPALLNENNVQVLDGLVSQKFRMSNLYTGTWYNIKVCSPFF